MRGGTCRRDKRKGAVPGRTVPIAARPTPLSLFTSRLAPVKRAPVFPALTKASPFPSASICRPVIIEESFFPRKTAIGSSSMVMTEEVCTISKPLISQAYCLAIRRSSSRLPTKTKLALHSPAADTTPRRTSRGALSPPIISTITRIYPSAILPRLWPAAPFSGSFR